MRLGDAEPGDVVQLVGVVVQEPWSSDETVAVEFHVTPHSLNREGRLTVPMYSELQVTVPTVVAATVRSDNEEGERA
jgi:hypothetical protein